MRVTDAIRIYEHSRVDLAVSSTAAHSAVLSEGIYDIVSDVDCWVKIAPIIPTPSAWGGLTAG